MSTRFEANNQEGATTRVRQHPEAPRNRSSGPPRILSQVESSPTSGGLFETGPWVPGR